MKKRLLVIALNFWPENFPINNFVLNLSRKFKEITILTGKPNYPGGRIFEGFNPVTTQKKKFFNKDNVFIYRVPIIPRGNSSIIYRILNYLSFIFSSLIFGTFLLKKKKFDLILVYAPAPVIHGFLGIYFGYLKKAKVSIWLQDLWPSSILATGYIKYNFIIKILEKLISLLYRSCDYIFVQSKQYFKIFNNLVSKNKIYYLPNPINIKSKTKIKKIKNFDKKNFNICYFGNIGLVQEFNTILNAAKIINNKKIQFHFFGEGVFKKEIKQLIEKKKINFFFLHDYIDESFLGNIIKKSSVLFLSLKKNKILNYTAPSKLQMYLSSKKIIIAEATGEIERIIKEAKCGYCIKHGNVSGLAKLISYLYKNKKKTKINKIALNGKSYYKKNFDAKNLARFFVKIIT